MSYEQLATSVTPALIIYLLDVSASMKQPLGGKRRIDIVMDALDVALRTMVVRSTKGARVQPRYHIAMYAYSDHVWDMLDGIKSVTDVASRGVPDLSPMHMTDTAQAFEMAEKLLAANLEPYAACPAPLVCHMTDGEYTGADPEPVVRRIRQMAVADGPVLVENIFMSDSVLSGPTPVAERWPGIFPDTALASKYADKLRDISSPLPTSYQIEMSEMGYQLGEGSLMMLPGVSRELVALGFQMSMATKMSEWVE